MAAANASMCCILALVALEVGRVTNGARDANENREISLQHNDRLAVRVRLYSTIPNIFKATGLCQLSAANTDNPFRTGI
jgi:hypothetical protein